MHSSAVSLKRIDGRPAATPRWIEIGDQPRKIVEAFAQRRHADRKDVQPEEQILAKLAAADARLEIAMGRGEDADVDAARLDAADTLERALLQHAQQLHLHVEAHVADLVEKQRAAVGELEPADASGDRARERAFLVAEELALEQLARDRAAIDRNERRVLARPRARGCAARRAPCRSPTRPGSARCCRSARLGASARRARSTAAESPTGKDEYKDSTSLIDVTTTTSCRCCYTGRPCDRRRTFAPKKRELSHITY